MTFFKGNIFYSLVRSNDTTSEGTTIFVFLPGINAVNK